MSSAVKCAWCEQWLIASEVDPLYCKRCGSDPRKTTPPAPIGRRRLAAAWLLSALWIGVWTALSLMLCISYWSEIWDWLSLLAWYGWLLVLLGLWITGAVINALLYGVAVMIWESITGREAFPIDSRETKNPAG